jgi:hypothetical protein
MTDLPDTIRDLRILIATGAANAEKIFDRTLFEGCGPMPPEVAELNLTAQRAAFYGFALVELLALIEAGEPIDAEEAVGVVNDIGMEGDDGRCADIWPDVQARLAEQAAMRATKTAGGAR